MKNIYKVIWSDEALKNLKEIIVYLEDNWSQKEIGKFTSLLDKQIHLIQNNPQLFHKSEILQYLRKSVLSKQVSIFYKVEDNEIHIVTLFDNRQDPSNLIKNK
jgi:plasmid stabilization system protein ParE